MPVWEASQTAPVFFPPFIQGTASLAFLLSLPLPWLLSYPGACSQPAPWPLCPLPGCGLPGEEPSSVVVRPGGLQPVRGPEGVGLSCGGGIPGLIGGPIPPRLNAHWGCPILPGLPTLVVVVRCAVAGPVSDLNGVLCAIAVRAWVCGDPIHDAWAGVIVHIWIPDGRRRRPPPGWQPRCRVVLLKRATKKPMAGSCSLSHRVRAVRKAPLVTLVKGRVLGAV